MTTPRGPELDAQLGGVSAGRKDDAGKPAMNLLPFDALEGVGAVLAFGAQKYGLRNWELGIAWGRLFAAALRHLGRWATGEDVDKETGLPHLDHAACCVLMLAALVRRGVGADDRAAIPSGAIPAASGAGEAQSSRAVCPLCVEEA